jgi:hypothetical protein
MTVMRSRDNPIGTVTRLQAREPQFDSRHGQEILLYSTPSRPTLWPTHPPIQTVPGALSPGVKRQGREADYSPSSADVCSYTSTPHMPSWHGAYIHNKLQG